jgi:hypothetical protein
MTSGARVQRVGPGEEIVQPRPGDIVLVRSRGVLAAIIYTFQFLRFPGSSNRPFRHWSHVALVTSGAGRLVEAGPRGLVAQSLAKYREREYHYVRVEATLRRRMSAVRLAEASVGQRYAVRTFLALGLSTLLGNRLNIDERGQQTCVAVVARAVARMTQVPLPIPAPAMMPADLAKHLRITP